MKRHNRRVEIIPTTPAHLDDLITNMNIDCRLECEALGYSPDMAVREAVQKSPESYTGLSDGKVGAIFGVAKFSMAGSVGRPWMLSTSIATKEWMYTAIASKRYILSSLKQYDKLENVVDFRYKKAIRWIRWLGFTIEKPRRCGVNGELLCRFYMYNKEK